MDTDLGDICRELLGEGVSRKELGKIAKRTNVSLLGSVPGTLRYDASSFMEGVVKTAACLGVGFLAGRFIGGICYEIIQPEVSKMACEMIGFGIVSGAVLFEGIEFNADRSSPGSKAYNHDLMYRILREKYVSILGKD
jgi:hypothetical protein